MIRPLLIAAVAVAATLAAAVTLRMSEAPYIAYAEGRKADAMVGLQASADKGDRFAAFLVATNYERGALGTPDRVQASDWYVKAARLGEVRAIARYVKLNVDPADSAQCDAALRLLDTAGRSGDPGSLTTLARYYEAGICTAADLATAARYYMATARIDRQFNAAVDGITARLAPDAAQGLQALPETFDLDAAAAITQFLAAIPLGTARATP